MKHPIFVLICLIFFLNVQAQTLDPVEHQLVGELNAGMQRSLTELEQAVNINSGTLNLQGVKQVGQLFREQLDEIGFTSQWVDGQAFNRAGHLVASYGTQGPKILLIGHLDTVFNKDDGFQHFEPLEPLDNNMIAGPGITDMKGGNVIIVAVMRALKAVGVLDKLRIRIVLTGDEESSGKPLSKSKHAIIQGAEWADIALGFEDGDSNIETAVISRRGSIGWQLDIQAKPAHSSQIFTEQVGYGALFEAARILNAFREKLQGMDNLTFNPGLLIGGTQVSYDAAKASGEVFGKSNVVAKTTLVKGDIRAVSPKQLETAKQMMQKIITDNLQHTTANLTFAAGYPPMAPTQGNQRLLALYSQVSQDLGYGPVTAVNPRNAGAADISFAADKVDMALDGLGLMGSGGHTKDEKADMTSFSKNMHKAAVLLYRLTKEQKEE